MLGRRRYCDPQLLTPVMDGAVEEGRGPQGSLAQSHSPPQSRGVGAGGTVAGWGDQEALPWVLNLSGCWICLEPASWGGAVDLDPQGLAGTSSGSRVGVRVWAPI